MRVLSWFRRFWGVVLIVLVVVAAVVVQQHTSSHGLPQGDAGLVVRQAGEATSSTLTVTADGGGTRSVSYDHPGVVLKTTLAPGAYELENTQHQSSSEPSAICNATIRVGNQGATVVITVRKAGGCTISE